jgi:hypothetical protein
MASMVKQFLIFLDRVFNDTIRPFIEQAERKKFEELIKKR